MVTINMLILKHLKYENSRSVIDIVLDKEMSVIDGIFTTDLEHQFQKVTGEKNTYRLESTPGDLMVLDLMKCMRKRQWMLMTSHSFMHLSLDKTMESHFYFERILTPNSSSSSSATGANPSVSELLSSYRTRPLNENEFVLEEEKTSYINSRISSHFGTTNSKLPGFTGMSSGGNNASSSSKSKEDPSAKPMPSPEVMAFILDKSATQSGPYGFAKRQTLLTAQHPRLKREANGTYYTDCFDLALIT